MRTEDFFGFRRQQSDEGRRDSYVFAEGSGERTSSFWDAYTWGRTRSPLNWEMGELSCHGKTAPRIVNGGSGEGRLGECEEFSWDVSSLHFCLLWSGRGVWARRRLPANEILVLKSDGGMV